MIVTYLTGERDNIPKRGEISWDDLAAELADPIVSECTTATCGSILHGTALLSPKGAYKGCRHKYTGAWSPCGYKPGTTRAKHNVEIVTALVLDVDHVTDAQLEEICAKVAAYNCIVHGSHGDQRWHPPMSERERNLRIAIELSEPVNAADWPRFWLQAVRSLGIPADPQACDASRLYFLPSHPSDVTYTCERNEGIPLDTASILALAPIAAVPAAPQPISQADFDASEPQKAEAHRLLAAHWPKLHGRHFACLALTGGLAQGGWQVDEIAAFVNRLIPLQNELDKHTDAARGTLEKIESGSTVKAWGSLAIDHGIPEETIDEVRSLLGMRSVDAKIGEHLVNLAKRPTEQQTIIKETIEAAKVMPVAERTYDDVLAVAYADVKSYIGKSTDDDAPEVPFFVSAGSLFDRSFPETPWLVRWLIVDSGIATIATEPKAGKTWLGTEIAIAVASGTRVCGKYDTTAGRVAYFYTEDMELSIRNRIRALAAGRGLDPRTIKNLFIQPRGREIDVTKDDDCIRIVASCRMIGNVKLLVLDPMRNIHSSAEDNSDEMIVVMKRLRMLGILIGCTVLFVHHTTKSSDTSKARRPGQRMRGSGAIHGAVDSGIYLEDVGGDGETMITSTVQSEVKAAKSAGQFHLTLKIEDDSEGASINATWLVAKNASAASATPGEVDELLVAMAEVMMAAEVMQQRPLPIHKKPGDASKHSLQEKLGRKTGPISAACEAGERAGYFTKHYVNKHHRGYVLTPSGKTLARSAQAPVRQRDLEPETP